MLYYDNKTTINIAHPSWSHKYMDVDQHFIKEKVDSRTICTPYVASTR